MLKQKTVIIIFLFICALVLAAWSKSKTQAIQYNHKKHIDSGMACEDCHLNVLEGARATIPALDHCMECHEQPVTESPEEEKIRTMAAEGVEYPWIKINNLKPDIYFSHRRHVTLGKLECGTCHGPMESLTMPPEKPFVKMKMKFCIHCHQEQGVTQDCVACHR